MNAGSRARPVADWMLGGSVARNLVVALLGLAAFLLLAEHAMRLPAVVPKNYVEGWNAFHTLRAFDAAPLYPAIDAITSNNYPPLSFYIVGVVASIVGDNIIAGRAVSFASMLVVATAIGIIVRRFTGSGSAGLFAALLFAGYVSARFENYIGMNDPQWLAHAIMTSGFWLFLRSRQQGAAFLLSIAVILAAGLVKHNLLALPLAITAWLFWEGHPSRVRWVACSAALLAGTMLGLYGLFGSEFFVSLLAAPRAYEPAVIALKLNSWLTPMLPLLGVWLVLAAVDRDAEDTRLVSLYVVIAAIWGVVICGGSGVGYNAFFDLVIALAIAAGLAVHRLSRAIARTDARALLGEAPLMLILSLTVLVAAPAGLIKGFRALERIDEDSAAVAADLEFLARQRGPAACEELALCYWAGKTFEMDVFNVGQKLRTGALDEDEIGALIDGNHFAVIQIENANGRTARLPKAINDRVHAGYRIVRQSSHGGAFLLPRTPR